MIAKRLPRTDINIVGNVRLIEQDYYKVDALSKSFLSKFSRSPAYAFLDMDTKAMKEGRAFHEYMLEQDEFVKNFVFCPHVDMRTKEAKEFVENEKDRTVLKNQLSYAFPKMKIEINRKTFMNIPFRDIIEEGIIEQGYLADAETNNMRFSIKCKPDLLYIHEDTVYIFDLKTCTNATAFTKDVYSYKYDWQSELYKLIIGHAHGLNTEFIFMPIEKTPPFGAMFYKVVSEYALSNIIDTIIEYHQWKLRGGDMQEGYGDQIKNIYV
jgi:hypothetical protein